MFSAPSITSSSAIREIKSVQDRPPTMGSMGLLQPQTQPQAQQHPIPGDYLDMVTPNTQNPSRAVAPAAPKLEESPVSSVSPSEIGSSRVRGWDMIKSRSPSQTTGSPEDDSLDSDHPLARS